MISKIITSLFLGITFLTLLLQTACAPQTEEDRIVAINKRIGPEGYITKTHLYINWPALKQGDEVVAEPLKLKIPLEYLVPGLTFIDKAPIEYAEESLLVQDQKITMVSMRMLPGAKPYVPLTPTKNLPSHEAKRKSEYFRSSYNVSVIRNNYFKSNTTRSEHLSGVNNWLLGEYVREPDIAGLERYIQTRCYDFDELKKRVMQGTHPNTLQRALDEVTSKASDDHSPKHCVEDRSYQYLAPAPESTPHDRNFFIRCHQTDCVAKLGLKERQISISISREDTMYEHDLKFAYSEKLKKELAEAKATNKEYAIKPFPQPMLDEVFTDLPKWREKVEPTLKLLNSFVINELPKNLEIDK